MQQKLGPIREPKVKWTEPEVHWDGSTFCLKKKERKKTKTKDKQKE